VQVKSMMIKAHKFVLAAISPVFLAEFYGPMRETSNPVPIERTTCEAFQKMIDFIYQNSFSLASSDIKTLCEVLDLSERYQMAELGNAVSAAIDDFVITERNILDVLLATEEFRHFQETSTKLFDSCVEFLDETLGTKREWVKFMMNHMSSGISLQVQQILYRVFCRLKCSNCGYVLEDCKNEEFVTSDNVAFGQKVEIFQGFVNETDAPVDSEGSVGIVKDIERNVNPAFTEILLDFDGQNSPCPYKIYDYTGEHNFLFHCN